MADAGNDKKDFFEVALDRGDAKQSLGFNFKKPQKQLNNDGSPLGFLIVSVIQGGILGQHNAKQASKDNWGAVVLPGMRIVAVNGLENNYTGMLKEIKDSRLLTLRIDGKRMGNKSGQTPVLDTAMLQDRVTGLIIKSRDRLRNAATDEEYRNVASSIGDEVVSQVSSLMQFQPSSPKGLPPPLPTQSKSAPVVGASNSYSTRPPFGAPAQQDDEVMSEESV